MSKKLHVVVLLLVYVNVIVFSEYLTISEGDSCSWKGMDGTCVKLHRCLSAKNVVNSNNRPPICEYQGEDPIICCTDCELVDDARNIIIDNIGILYKTGQKAHDHCLDFKHKLRYFQRGTTRINKREWKRNETLNCQELKIVSSILVSPAGGMGVSLGDFPHMALLGYGPKWPSAQWLCGGTVISATFVLTAGHCISSPAVGPVTYIGVHLVHRSAPPSTWERYRVKRRIPHPDYHPPSKYHDIALLETSTPILFESVKPACLNKREDDGQGYYEATGWGKLGHNRELAETLQVIHLEEFTEEECMREYPPHRHLVNGYNHTTQMCYGRRDQLIDTCEGDSGGPLHDREYHSNHVIGVTSYGRSCAISTGAGIYTRVSFYLPWIESIVWPESTIY